MIIIIESYWEFVKRIVLSFLYVLDYVIFILVLLRRGYYDCYLIVNEIKMIGYFVL